MKHQLNFISIKTNFLLCATKLKNQYLFDMQMGSQSVEVAPGLLYVLAISLILSNFSSS